MVASVMISRPVPLRPFKSLQFEESRLEGDDISGGSTDIYKCFDQIQLGLLCDLLELAGFPPGPLQAYRTFHANCLYHNTLAGGVGLAHRHICGIPQGCPLSMTFIVFSLHPWTRLIRSMQAVPRSLADDLLVYAVGKNHAEIAQAPYAATFCYLHSLGVKVSATKCYLFSTCNATRATLRQRYWVHISAKVQVFISMRDLGGHLHTGSKLTGTMASVSNPDEVAKQ